MDFSNVKQDGSPESLAYLRAESLGPVLYCILVVSYLWYVAGGQPIDMGRGGNLWGPITLIVGLALAFLFRKSNLTIASMSIILSVAVAATYSMWTTGMFAAPYLLAVVVSLTGLLFGLKTVVYATVFCDLLILGIGQYRWDMPFYTNDIIVPMLVIAAVGILSSLGVRNLYLTLHWAWDRTIAAERNQEELRDRQGELARTLKALDLSYKQLEHLNHDLAAARHEAEEARLLKQQFVTNVSHELRTPLNVIVAFSEMMYLSPESYNNISLPAPYRGDVREVYRNSKHLLNLIEDILDLSQIEARRMRFYPQSENLREVVDEAIEIVRPLVERQKSVTLTSHIPADIPPVLIDKTRVRQVLVNLINNAKRFTEHGSISVSATVDDDVVTVTVADTGIGVPPQDQHKVFEAFRQVDGTTTRQRDGTGLGLFISKRFVEIQGGRIWLESNGIPGEGCKFHFTLPLIGQRRLSYTEPGRSQLKVKDPADKGRTVLLLGGNSELVQLLDQGLDSCQVLPVNDAADIPALLQEQFVRAIIVNLAHKKQARHYNHQLRQLSGSLNVPIITCPLVGTQEFGRALGAFDYLTKPVSRQQVLKLIARLEAEGTAVNHILLVDDDPNMTNLMQRMLQTGDKSYDISRASNGREGLRTMREVKPDLVLLDLTMPEMNGFTMLEHVKADPTLARIPVALITAHTRTPEEERELSGKTMLISSDKGFTNDDVLSYLRGILKYNKLPESLPHPQQLIEGSQ